jgi:RNA polymerase sigma-70 factor (ECF subfamily)
MVTASAEGIRETPDFAREFEALFVDAWPRVFSYAWVLLRDHTDAEDVAAETFARAYGAWAKGLGPRTDSIAWLIVIARRLVIDRRRRDRLIGWLPLHLTADAGSRDRGLERSETAMWFRELAAALPPRQHEAFLLRYEFDLSDEQAGLVMGITAGGVRTLVSRALAVLRKRPEVWKW